MPTTTREITNAFRYPIRKRSMPTPDELQDIKDLIKTRDMTMKINAGSEVEVISDDISHHGVPMLLIRFDDDLFAVVNQSDIIY